ncbi:hypothetical protein EWM64_g1762 [Hericium alpestre]|uniref:Uncharacterized protein n=1 Tax=Hericium alpestre TaxID=135208 RepID=A0A4Z0A8J9_9AGAM|nr:hypothetical protein EWM64_g1762 [Hericium alpestre]
MRPSLPDQRRAQELAILNEIPQNGVPWNLLNMRNIAMDNTVTRKTKKGTFWADLWNGIMPLCKGYNTSGRDKEKRLPCHASSVIYGHTASRGLDLQRWTLGLDSGCVYGRSMSALVLDADSSATDARRVDVELRAPDDEDDEDDVKHTTVKFGDNGQARIVSVDCHQHEDSKHRLEDEKDDRR